MVIGITVHSEIMLINMTGNLKWLLDILSMKDCFSNIYMSMYNILRDTASTINKKKSRLWYIYVLWILFILALKLYINLSKNRYVLRISRLCVTLVFFLRRSRLHYMFRGHLGILWYFEPNPVQTNPCSSQSYNHEDYILYHKQTNSVQSGSMTWSSNLSDLSPF